MDIEEFARAVVTVRRRHHGTITSWGRDDDDATGIPSGPHGWDLGADMVYRFQGKRVANRPGSETHPSFPNSCPQCSEEGLKVIHERPPRLPHDHYQPMNFPAGPVVEYHGSTRTWVA